MRLLAALLIVLAAPASAADLISAGGQWVALDRGASCEATSRSERIALKGKVQARAGFAFDRARRGQFFADEPLRPTLDAVDAVIGDAAGEILVVDHRLADDL